MGRPFAIGWRKRSPVCEINLNNISIAKIFEIEEGGDVIETYIALQSGVNYENDVYLPVASGSGDLMYQRVHRNKCQDDFIHIIRDVSVDGTRFIHDVRGNHQHLAEFGLRYDIIRNAIYDKLILNGSTWIAAPNGITQKALDYELPRPCYCQ